MRYKVLAAALLLLLAIAALLAVHVQEPKAVTTGPLATAKLERTFRLGPSPARQPLFSDDGSLLALSNAAGDVFLLRTENWSLEHRMRHDGGATSLAFAPNGTQIYTAGYDGGVRRWDLRRGRFGGRIGATGGTIWSLDVSPDGTTIAAAGEDKVVHLWRITPVSPAMQLRGHAGNIWQAKFSPDGRYIATGSFDYSARTWDVVTGRQSRVLDGHTQAVVGLDYRHDGLLLATSGDDNSIRFWRLSDAALLRAVESGNHTYSISFSPDGRWLVSGGRGRSALGTMIYGATGLGRPATPIHIWRVADGALVEALPDETDVFHVAFAPDGRHFVSANDNGIVRLWRLEPMPGSRGPG